jgi:hypothetical protein
MRYSERMIYDASGAGAVYVEPSKAQISAARHSDEINVVRYRMMVCCDLKICGIRELQGRSFYSLSLSLSLRSKFKLR